MNRTLIPIDPAGIDDATWDDRISSHPAGRLAQSTVWAAFQHLRGWQSTRLAVGRSDQITASAQVLTRRLPLGRRVGYVGRGPVVDDRESADVMASELRRFASRARLEALIVDPADGCSAASLVAAGFSPAKFNITLAATVAVDLDADDEELLGRMKPKTRYNIRKADREGVVIRIGDHSDVDVFHRMLAETGRRQGFAADGRSYIETALGVLGPGNGAALFMADHREVPLAGILVTAFGDRAVYKRGGWSGNGGSLHPNEALHWAAMRWARDTRRRWYDFDGIDPAVLEDPESGGGAAQSVARFKLGFGGDVIPLPKTLVFLRNPALRWMHESASAASVQRFSRLARRFQVSP